MPVRIAHLVDIEAMHRVRLAVTENRLRDLRRVTPEHYREMLEERGRGWVCEIDGELRGFAIADRADRNIWALFVAPGFEGRGIGRALHDTMVAWLFDWATRRSGSARKQARVPPDSMQPPVGAKWTVKGMESCDSNFPETEIPLDELRARFLITPDRIHGADKFAVRSGAGVRSLRRNPADR
jgi:GNAT superfamily N-acetyltransferase